MILVTGGTGLVGSHLLYDLVKKDEPVRAIIRNRDKIELVKKVFSYYSDDYEKLIQKINWVQGDILDLYSLEESFSEVRKVYHCAAIVSFDGKDKNELINANVQGTENVVNLCLSNNIEKLCHVSSIASLGGALNGEPIDENNKWTTSKNRSTYSVSKFKSEMEVWRGVQEGLNAVVVNPSVILGPGFWNSGSGSLFSKAAKGLKYFTKGATGFVDVRDVSESMIELMESNFNAERFILNTDNLFYKDLFDKIADSMNVAKPKKEAGSSLLKLAVFFDSIAGTLRIKKREITKEIIKSSTSVSKYSNEKIKKTIGKTFIPIDKSIGEIAEKFKNELTMS
ncbi:MAG: NAD-dependent epimerase/dehydratase family protein [Bacteroidales bacterium]|jgi:dihydroflavonol-4-reductase|nr:NAD-dependent epimerase/dehydratase family protein [Bacteroidales bacterium]